MKHAHIAPTIAGLALGLAGCSLTLPVRGVVEGTGEVFSGAATGGSSGAGTLRITSARTSCDGQFVYVTRRQGKGTFVCADGRTGPFEFVSTGRQGTGTGDFGGRRFTFTFGG
jgi:hypothetical protein